MSKRRTHNSRVAFRNLYGSRMWWFTCTCGDKQGSSDKQEMLAYRKAHIARYGDGKGKQEGN